MALGDHLTVTDLTLEAYERALMPMLNDGHFDAYQTDFASSDGGRGGLVQTAPSLLLIIA